MGVKEQFVLSGYVFTLQGKLDSRHFDLKTQKTSFFKRVFGQSASSNLEINSNEYIKLKDELIKLFQTYLVKELAQPWEASKIVIDYLSDLEIYLVGNKSESKDEITWFMNFRFPGCSGLCDVTSAVGVHWLVKWLGQEFDMVEQNYLMPFGFHPLPPDLTVEEPFTFLPIDLGQNYAKFTLLSRFKQQLAEAHGVTNFEPEHLFELDSALFEESEFVSTEETSSIPEDYVEKLEAKYTEFMSDELCRCQLCMPEFDLSSIAP